MLDQNDLKILSELLDKQKNEILTEVRQEISQTKQDLQQEISQTRQDLQQEIAQSNQSLKQELLQEIQQAKNEAIQESAHNTKVLLESLVAPRFDLLAEGHQTLLETLAPKSRVEDLEEDVALLKGVVRNLSFDVSELKAAR